MDKNFSKALAKITIFIQCDVQIHVLSTMLATNVATSAHTMEKFGGSKLFQRTKARDG
jgi:hypothetical protein